MPMRYIQIPADVHIVEPDKKPAKDEKGAEIVVSFEKTIQRLLMNPKWIESYPAIQSADAVAAALDDAKNGVMVLAEEDFNRLKEVAMDVKGLGHHPIVARQILPQLRAIIDATNTAPAQPLKAVE